MNAIIKNYNLLVKKFQKMEFGFSENEIHDKRVILRRVFPILAAYKIKPSKVKNGENAFKLFGKLRDIQVQVLKLESIDQTPEIMEYLSFLQEGESELKEKVRKFCKKKELEFPTIKKKSTLDKAKILAKTNKSLDKLIERIHSRSIDDAEDVHKIRIEFKKFRYRVEILSYLENIEKDKLEVLKIYQDKLGEIQDYEVLITGIRKYCKKRKLDGDEMTELFEHDQNTLIENFDNHIELFIAVCKDVLVSNEETESLKDTSAPDEESGLMKDQPESSTVAESSTDGQVSKIVDSLVTNKRVKENRDNITKATDEAPSIESTEAEEPTTNPAIENVEEGHAKEDKTNDKSDTGIYKATKSNTKKKQSVDKDIQVDPDHID